MRRNHSINLLPPYFECCCHCAVVISCEEGDEGKGHEGNEQVKDGSTKLVAQAIKDQLSHVHIQQRNH